MTNENTNTMYRHLTIFAQKIMPTLVYEDTYKFERGIRHDYKTPYFTCIFQFKSFTPTLDEVIEQLITGDTNGFLEHYITKEGKEVYAKCMGLVDVSSKAPLILPVGQTPPPNKMLSVPYYITQQEYDEMKSQFLAYIKELKKKGKL